jgi:hypothetical protein
MTPAKRNIASLLRQAENRIASSSVENALAYDGEGNEVLNKAGTVSEISITQEEQAKLVGASLVHNHPDGVLANGTVIRDLPPSVDDDLDLLLNCKLNEIRVVTGNFRYSLKANPDPRYHALDQRVDSIRRQWHDEYAQLRRDRYRRLVRRCGEPLPPPVDIDFDERIAEDSHKTWLKLAESCNLKYHRESRG